MVAHLDCVLSELTNEEVQESPAAMLACLRSTRGTVKDYATVRVLLEPFLLDALRPT